MDSFEIEASMATTEIVFRFGYEGKTIELTGYRRDLMNVLREASDKLYKLEPGK